MRFGNSQRFNHAMPITACCGGVPRAAGRATDRHGLTDAPTVSVAYATADCDRQWRQWRLPKTECYGGRPLGPKMVCRPRQSLLRALTRPRPRRTMSARRILAALRALHRTRRRNQNFRPLLLRSSVMEHGGREAPDAVLHAPRRACDRDVGDAAVVPFLLLLSAPCPVDRCRTLSRLWPRLLRRVRAGLVAQTLLPNRPPSACALRRLFPLVQHQ